MKRFFLVFLFLTALALVAVVSYKTAALRYQSQITRLQGDVSIYRSEAERYGQLLRTIRETAATATVTEKAM